MKPGDVLIGINYNNSAKSVTDTFMAAKKAGATTMLITAVKKRRAVPVCGYCVLYPNQATQQLSEHLHLYPMPVYDPTASDPADLAAEPTPV